MNSDDFVISSRIRFARNVNNLPFPHRLDGSEGQLQSFLNTVQKVCKSKFDGKTYCTDDMRIGDEVHRQMDFEIYNMLVENHLISPTLANSKFSGAIISKDRTVSVMFNEEDHLREQCILDGLRLDEAYAKLLQIDEVMHDKLDIAYKKGYGHLTSCPTNLGAGMRASVMMFLPALEIIGELKSLIKKFQAEDVTIRGVYGEGSGARGFMYQISNQAAVGWSESRILDSIKRTVAYLCEREEFARKVIWESKGIDLEDQIMRAYGTLLFAKLISSDEFMINIANVKLGISYGLLKLDIKAVNRLIPKVQPHTLNVIEGRKLSLKERDKLRADTVREGLIKSKI